MSDINDNEILDDLIRGLQKRLKEKDMPFKDTLKLQDMVLKALSMRRKDRGKKGRGFDLGK